jgi:hypothetical protein
VRARPPAAGRRPPRHAMASAARSCVLPAAAGCGAQPHLAPRLAMTDAAPVELPVGWAQGVVPPRRPPQPRRAGPAGGGVPEAGREGRSGPGPGFNREHLTILLPGWVPVPKSAYLIFKNTAVSPLLVAAAAGAGRF